MNLYSWWTPGSAPWEQGTEEEETLDEEAWYAWRDGWPAEDESGLGEAPVQPGENP